MKYVIKYNLINLHTLMGGQGWFVFFMLKYPNAIFMYFNIIS